MFDLWQKRASRGCTKSAKREWTIDLHASKHRLIDTIVTLVIQDSSTKLYAPNKFEGLAHYHRHGS